VTGNGRRATFLGAPIDLLDMTETVEAIARHVDEGRPGVHLGVNAANLVMAHDDPAYRADLGAGDLVTADGQSVVWGSRFIGLATPERVTGIDLMDALLRTARARDWGIYLLGARRDVVDRLAAKLSAEGTRVSGHRDGYFGPDESDAVAAEVVGSGAQLLFVGTPSPAKERFVVHHARPAGVPFSVGVGGSFDVLAGELRRAPGWMQRAGLEWLFRLLQEPGRLFRRYAVTNTRYAWLLARDILGRRRRRRR
jgi:N-acetylglucosaminyldiphosphoundecaprenol N-acetyl-beta-D-mannosaminyltransferase